MCLIMGIYICSILDSLYNTLLDTKIFRPNAISYSRLLYQISQSSITRNHPFSLNVHHKTALTLAVMGMFIFNAAS